MNIKTLKDEDLEKHFKVSVPAADLEKTINSELQKLAPTVKIPGFRPGKVPLTMVKKKYGDALRSDAINTEIRLSVEKILKDKKLKTINPPSVDDLTADEGKDLEFTLKMELFPTIPAVDFSKIKLEKPVAKPDAKDIENRIKEIAKSNVSYDKESKAKAENGDQVTLDCVGYVNGKAFDGGALNGHKLVLGSGAFIPGYEEQLVGTKAGDDVSVNVTFPKEYHMDELAGKEAEFKVKVHAVHKPSEAKIDDDLAKKFGMKDLAELKSKITDGMKNSFADDVTTILKMKLFDELEKALQFEVPKSMLDREYNLIKSQADQSNASDEKDSKKKTEDKKLDEALHRIALRRVRIGLMLANYAEENKISLTSDDIKNAILKQASMFPGQEQLIVDYYVKNQKALESLKGPILEGKAVQDIIDNKISSKEKEYSISDLEKMLKEENDKELI